MSQSPASETELVVLLVDAAAEELVCDEEVACDEELACDEEPACDEEDVDEDVDEDVLSFRDEGVARTPDTKISATTATTMTVPAT